MHPLIPCGAIRSPAQACATRPQVPHYIYLSGIYADSPARQKLACWPGTSAYIGCGWCRFQAQRVAVAVNSKNMFQYYFGYDVPAPQDLRHGPPAKVRDPSLQLTDEEQRERGHRVQQAPNAAQREALAKCEGCSGLSPIFDTLSYVSPNNVFLVPHSHALLRGVVASFVAFMLGPGPPRAWCSPKKPRRS